MTKKNINLLALIAICVVLFCACTSSKPFNCDLCGEEKTGTQYVSKEKGIELTVCEDCYNELQKAFNFM